MHIFLAYIIILYHTHHYMIILLTPWTSPSYKLLKPKILRKERRYQRASCKKLLFSYIPCWNPMEYIPPTSRQGISQVLFYCKYKSHTLGRSWGGNFNRVRPLGILEGTSTLLGINVPIPWSRRDHERAFPSWHRLVWCWLIRWSLLVWEHERTKDRCACASIWHLISNAISLIWGS